MPDADHAGLDALLLDAVALANGPAAAGRYEELARALGEEPRPADPPGGAFARAVARLRELLGMGSGIARIGARAEDIAALAENASRDPCMATNPRPMSAAEIAEVYARAL